MTDTSTSAALAALLAWQRDMGCDDIVGEMPIDWLSRGDAAPGHTFRLAGTPAPAAPATARGGPAAAQQQPAARMAPPRAAQVPAPAAVRPAPAAPRQLPAASPDDALTAAR